jgi:hypothetical protein
LKVKVTIKSTINYFGELTMTKEEYEELCDRIDNSRGFAREKIANDLIEKIGLDLADPSDWGTLDIEDFEEI